MRVNVVAQLERRKCQDEFCDSSTNACCVRRVSSVSAPATYPCHFAERVQGESDVCAALQLKHGSPLNGRSQGLGPLETG